MKEIDDNKSLKKECLIDNKPALGINKWESNKKSAKENTKDFFFNNNETKKHDNKINNTNKTSNNKNHNKNNKIENNIQPNKKCFYFV